MFYRTSSQNNVQVLNTNKTSAELLLPIKEDYIIEVKATTEGGDGTSSEQIRIPRITSKLTELIPSFPFMSVIGPYNELVINMLPIYFSQHAFGIHGASTIRMGGKHGRRKGIKHYSAKCLFIKSLL